MEERRKRILTVLVVSSILLGLALAVRKPVPLELVSYGQATFLRLSDKGEILDGYYTFSFLVRQWDTLRLRLAVENTPVENIPNYSGPRGYGWVLVPNAYVDLVLEPVGQPLVHGRICEVRYIYDDAPHDIVTPDGRSLKTTRMWRYYEVLDWIGKHACYRIRLIKNGVEAVSKTVLVGGDASFGDTVGDVEIPYGDSKIKVRQLGLIPQGLSVPPPDFCYIWDSSGSLRCVKKDDLTSKLKTPLGSGLIKIGYVGATKEPSKKEESYYRWEWSQLIPPASCKVELWFPDTRAVEFPRIKVKGYQDFAFGTAEITWTFGIVEYKNIDLDRMYVKFDILNPSALGSGGDEFRIINPLTQKKVAAGHWVPLSSDGTFKLYYKCEGGTLGEVLIQFSFAAPADTWKEFVQQTGVEWVPSYSPANLQVAYVDTTPDMNSPPYSLIRRDVLIWNPKDTRMNLYSRICPESTDPSAPAGSSVKVNYYTVLGQLPGGTFNVWVYVEIPVRFFDAWVYIPPYGKPKVQKVDPPELTLTPATSVQVNVYFKNEGRTPDTFALSSLSLPPGVVISSYVSNFVNVDVGKEGVISFKLQCGGIERESKQTVKGTISATSGESDTFEFSLTLKPQVGPVINSGRIEVYVMDKDTGQPIGGAKVSCDGQEALTDSSGFAMFPVRIGEKGEATFVVSAGKEGYYSESTKLKVSAGGVATWTFYLSSKRKEERVWLKWALVAVVLSSVSAVAYLIYSRKLRR